MTKPNEREAIYNLQRYLRQLSYHDAAIPAPPLDGVMDTATTAALRAFQKGEKLPVTGTADRTTWDALFAAYRQSISDYSAPLEVSVFPRAAPGFALRLGDKTFPVQFVQFALQELELIYTGLGAVTLSRVYDENTESAVKLFQGKNNLPETGEVDRLTWDELAAVYNREFGGNFEQ